jgi:DNA-binding NarL/FixJ family response regulator
MKILVAHPSPSVLDGMAHALESRLGLEIVKAANPAQCAELVAALRPDLAVLDVALSPGRELELCRATTRDGVPVLIVTRAGAGQHLALLEHGALGIVLSDDGFEEFLTAVRTVLKGHAYLPAQLLGTVLHDLIVKRRVRDAESGAVASLSPRERQVLKLLGEGADTRQIAHRLVISPHTAKTHINRVMSKLSVRSRSEAAAVAWASNIMTSTMEPTHGR